MIRQLIVTATAMLLPVGTGNAAVSPPCPIATAATAAPAVASDLPVFELCGPAPVGGGPWPAFRWDPVAGAAGYQLVVLAAAGDPLWAWTGTDTHVVLGAWTEPPTHDVPGLSLTAPAEWFVVALGAGGVPIAISPRQPVAP